MPLRYVPSARIRRAARKAYEAGLSLDLLAELTGRTRKYWATVAVEEGWRIPDAGATAGTGARPPTDADPAALEQRLMALSDELVNELEAAVCEGRASGTYDKGRVDALSAMLRMVEKLGETTRGPQRAAEKKQEDDAQLAAALALVDARIVELACELAASLGGRDAEPGNGGAAAA